MAEKILKNQKKESIFDVKPNIGSEVVGNVVQENQMSPDDYADLIQQSREIDDKKRASTTKHLLNKNKIRSIKRNLLKELLQTMKDNGVDVGDLNSINKFLDSLEQQDPDLKMLFEFYFNSLTDDEKSENVGGELPSDPIAPQPQSQPQQSPQVSTNQAAIPKISQNNVAQNVVGNIPVR